MGLRMTEIGALLRYCDYIAHRIQRALSTEDSEQIIGKVGSVKSDLHPVGGWMVSLTKTIEITGRNGARYRVTVEKIP
jgi:hypothetical protein